MTVLIEHVVTKCARNKIRSARRVKELFLLSHKETAVNAPKRETVQNIVQVVKLHVFKVKFNVWFFSACKDGRHRRTSRTWRVFAGSSLPSGEGVPPDAAAGVTGEDAMMAPSLLS